MSSTPGVVGINHGWMSAMGDQCRNWQSTSHGDRLVQPARMRGAIIIKTVVLIPVMFLVLLALVFAFYEGRKAYWDYRVGQMCEKDGGVVVMEQMQISQEQEKYLPHADSVVSVSPESLADPHSPAFARAHKEIIKGGQPKIVRIEHEIIRRSDGKRIATAVIYLRAGGGYTITSLSKCVLLPFISEN